MKGYKELRKFNINGETMVLVEMESTGSCCTMTEREFDRIIWNESAKNRERLKKGA